MAPQLIMKAGPQPNQIYPLTRRVTVIGRDSAADIVINANFISRRHLRVGVQNDVVFIEDLGSSNGTYVNGKRIPPKQVVVLEHGDQLGVGPEVSFLVEAPAPQAEPAHTMIYQPAEAAPHTMLMATPPENDDDLVTQIGEAVPPLAADEMHPPQLVVTVAGAEPRLYTLTADRLSIGRAKDNDIVIDSPFVSRQHAELQRMVGGYQLIPAETTNPIQVEGRAIVSPITLHDDAKLRIGGSNPGEMVTLVYLSPDAMFGSQAAKSVSFDEKSLISIGRDKSNDIVLDSPNVSRFHANIEKVGLRYRLRDLRSANGTFVNDQPVNGETWIKQADSVRVGPYRFEIGAEKLTQFDESGGMRIEAIGLNKWVRKDLNILQDISLVFQPREFIVVVGQSGGGKSTLVDAISGYRRASHGQILANEIDVYENFDAIRQGIGYVPQKDIIHMELSVFQALDYAAQLRMPPDTTEAERHQRIDEVLADLDLTHRRDVKISGLSGGQQKRVSIGVELLTKPGLFFLDEPSSGLDPGTETALMQLMRRLADQGRTIILITHATKNVMLADKVVFLARGGYLAWFGPPEEALAYFDSYRTDRERREKPIEFDDIYNLLDRPDMGQAADWAARYKEQPAYEQYVARPLAGKLATAPGAATPVVKTKADRPVQRKQVSALRQFIILSTRNIKILTRDRFALILMLLTTPIISTLDFVLALSMGRELFSFQDGSVPNVIVSLVVMINNGIMVGGLSQMRELVKEQDIYRRERMVNLKLLPYIMSKIWVAALLALLQAAIFVLVRYLAFDMPGGALEILFLYVTLVLAILAGMSLGLFASAAAPNSNTAPLLLILFLIPQLVLSGGIVPLPPAMTFFASSRWSFQSAMAFTGVGSDVAGDACWALPEEERDLLTYEQKDSFCSCMGPNALRAESCNFPGLGDFYDAAIDAPEPVEPAEIRDEPEPLVLPPAPALPADQNDPVAMQQYLIDLTNYNEEATSLRESYEADLNAYRSERQLYETQLLNYRSDVGELEVDRATATSSAESTIETLRDDFGWTFVNQANSTNYYSTLAFTWLSQFTIVLVLLVGTVIMQKRKDVA